MTYNFTKAPNRKGAYAGKWTAMTLWSPHANEHTLPFWVADMDFDVAPQITDAMKSEIDRLTFGYSVATPQYFEVTSAWLNRRYGWEVSPSNIRIASGTLHAISTMIKIASKQDDGIIVQTPVYHKFAELVTKHGRTVVENPLVEQDGEYDINFAQLEELASQPNNSLMLLCHPHNPVGCAWTQEELVKVADICGRHNVTLVSDEIHSDLTRMGVTHLPVSKAVGGAPHIVTLNGTGKTFNLAGMHISHAIFDGEELRNKWDAEIGLTLPNPVSMAAVEAAYTKGDEWVDGLRNTLDGNFEFTQAYLAKHLPKVKMTIPNATYFAWLDFRAFDLTDAQIDEIMIKEANILLEGGPAFGTGGEGWQRLNLACTHSQLEEGLKRMCAAFANYK
ncbi:MalY/PatB family protein [Vibrio superstes]|uniref:cysteine-S-conjugate beta-lyase n=1 Tax=Vibrio superstes NBRC 103154 TaxID=1219062 RepID=A0A511QP18_9VIBR|nr:MalY/PatB family protein [Vibrio superstes]GEM79069.1 cystathionine beta-lyase [Vibrio superstes NBRC 103154]